MALAKAYNFKPSAEFTANLQDSPLAVFTAYQFASKAKDAAGVAKAFNLPYSSNANMDSINSTLHNK